MQNVKNMDFCIGTPCYWLIGFGLMFGFNGGSSLSLSTDAEHDEHRNNENAGRN